MRAPNVVSRGELEHLLAIDRRIEAPIEAIERLGAGQRRPPHPQRQLLLRPPLDLIFQEPFQKLALGPLSVDGLALARRQGCAHAREPELLEPGR